MRTISFTRHRFPPDIIRHAVWLYARFTLSYRDVEDLLAERGLDISYENRPTLVSEVWRANCSQPAPDATNAQRLLASR
jgi:transposase-like protein